MTLEETIERDEELRAIGCPYVDHTINPDGTWNIPTVDESVYWEFAAGLITLEEAADEFNRNGWTPYRDIAYTKKCIAKLNEKYHKINDIQL